jgi:hypothetical protein
MSKNENAVSVAARDEPESDSVFDFLYHDVRRVGSFLAQFDDAGHLQQITQSDGSERGTKRGFKASAGGSIPLLGAANLSLERGPDKGGYESAERVYDPLWANARTLLDYLTERDMLRRSLAEARIGQFVLVSGSLVLLDLPMLKASWGNQTVQKMIRDGATSQAASGINRQQRRAQGQPGNAHQLNPEIELLMALLTMLPHVLQCRMIGPDVNTWCNLDEEFVVGKASDLTLKHGTLLQGDWQMLGIMDAYPDSALQHGSDLADVLSQVAATPVGQMSAALAPVARTLLGRPNEAHGITPLLIFREITG